MDFNFPVKAAGDFSGILHERTHRNAIRFVEVELRDVGGVELNRYPPPRLRSSNRMVPLSFPPERLPLSFFIGPEEAFAC